MIRHKADSNLVFLKLRQREQEPPSDNISARWMWVAALCAGVGICAIGYLWVMP